MVEVIFDLRQGRPSLIGPSPVQSREKIFELALPPGLTGHLGCRRVAVVGTTGTRMLKGGAVARSFLIVGVFGDASTRVGFAEDLVDVLRKWTERYGPFIPVVAHRTTPDAIRAVCGTKTRLSNTLSMIEAAALFGRLPVDKAALPIVNDHIQKLGPFDTGSLISGWQSAVDSTIGGVVAA